MAPGPHFSGCRQQCCCLSDEPRTQLQLDRGAVQRPGHLTERCGVVGDAKQAFPVTSHQVEAQRGAHRDTWDLSLASPQISLHIHRHRKSVTTKEIEIFALFTHAA
jgi:hypothetical protein